MRDGTWICGKCAGAEELQLHSPRCPMRAAETLRAIVAMRPGDGSVAGRAETAHQGGNLDDVYSAGWDDGRDAALREVADLAAAALPPEERDHA